jgi:hypothetical protein
MVEKRPRLIRLSRSCAIASVIVAGCAGGGSPGESPVEDGGFFDAAPPSLVDAGPDVPFLPPNDAPSDSCTRDADCDDGNPCTSDHCARSTEFGTCEHSPVADGTSCGGDAGACIEKVCMAGVCVSGGPSGGSDAGGQCIRFEACVDMEDQVSVSCGNPLVVTHLQGSLIGEHPMCAGMVSTVNPAVSLYDPNNGVFVIDGVAYPLSATPSVSIGQLLNHKQIAGRGTVSFVPPHTVDVNDVPDPGPDHYVVDLCN